MPARSLRSTYTSTVKRTDLAGADTTTTASGKRVTTPKPEKNKSLEQWIWDAACSIRGAKDAPKYKDFILPLRPGDLLFVRTNGVKDNAGRCSKFNGELERCYFASYLIRVRFNPKIMNAEFVNEFSRTEIGTSMISGRSIRTADGKDNINSGTLKTLLVPVPAIDEQVEIAKTFCLIDKKAVCSQSKKANLRDLFSVLLHELMTSEISVSELQIPEFALLNGPP